MKTKLVYSALLMFCLVTGGSEAARWIVPAGAHVAGAANTNWRTLHVEDWSAGEDNGVEVFTTWNDENSPVNSSQVPEKLNLGTLYYLSVSRAVPLIDSVPASWPLTIRGTGLARCLT